MTDEKQRTLTVRLPESMHRRLKIRVAQEGTSIAAVWRKFVDQYLEKTGESKKDES